MWRKLYFGEYPHRRRFGDGRRGARVLGVVVLLAAVLGTQAFAQTTYRLERTLQQTLTPTGVGYHKAVAFGDVDHDGFNDIVFAYRSKNWTAYNSPPNYVFGWYKNNAGTGWILSPPYPTATYTPPVMLDYIYNSFNKIDILSDIQVADITGDDMPEIFFCTHTEGILYYPNPIANSGWAASPTAVWARVQQASYNWGPYYPNTRKLALADVDLSGRKDIIAAIGETGSGANQQGVLRIWLNNGSGGFASYYQILDWQNPPAILFPVSIRAQDVAGTPHPELFVCAPANVTDGATAYNGRVIFCYTDDGTTVGSWRREPLPGTYNKPFDTAFADMNGDGRLDVVVAQEISPTVRWLNNTGIVAPLSGLFSTETVIDSTRTGTYNEMRTIVGSTYPNDLYPIFAKGMDLDKDGDGDVIVSYNSLSGNTSGELVYYENTGNGATWDAHVLTASPADTNPMQIDTVAAIHPSSPYPDPAGQSDTYPDFAVMNAGTPGVSFWDNKLYEEAPYVKALTLITPTVGNTDHFRQLEVEFSKAMLATNAANANDALNPSLYALAKVSGPNTLGLAVHPDSVQNLGSNKFRLIWNSGNLGLGNTISVTVVNTVVENDTNTATQARLRAPYVQQTVVPGLPTAAFTPSTAQAGYAPLAVTFDPSTSSGGGATIAEWRWDWTADGTDDITRTVQQTENQSYATPGVYSVKLTVVTAWGSNSTTKTQFIQVWPADLAVTATVLTENSGTPNDGTIYVGSPVQFSVAASNGYGAYSYRWQYSSNVSTPSYSNISNGTVSRNVAGSGGVSTAIDVTYSGATTNTLQIDRGVEPGLYRCVVTTPDWPIPAPPPPVSVNSAPAQLTVDNTKLAIIGSLADTRRYTGPTEVVSWSFTVIGGDGVPTNYHYQWYKEGTPNPIFQANTLLPSWGINGLDTSREGYYFCSVSWDNGSGVYDLAETNHAHLEVRNPVTVTNTSTTVHKNTGNNLTLNVTIAGGYPPYTIKWQYDNGAKAYVDIAPPAHPSGSTAVTSVDPSTGTLTITGLTLIDKGAYHCIAQDSFTPPRPSSTGTSAATALSISDLPTVTDPTPSPQHLYEGQSATFNVTAADGVSTSFTFQWQRDLGAGWVNINNGGLSGRATVSSVGTGSQLTISGLTLGDEAQYRCTASNLWSEVGTPANPGELFIYGPLAVVSTTPADVTENVGNTADFVVQTTGGIPPLTYAWEWCTGSASAPGGAWAPIVTGTHPGDAASTVTVADDTLSVNIQSTTLLNTWYRCVTVTDSGTPQTAGPSRAARLIVTNFMNILTDPQDVRAYAGEAGLQLNVSVTAGVPPYSYDWKQNGTSLSGFVAGANVLNLGVADRVAHPGSYTVVIRDSSGGVNPDVTSAAAQVQVANPPSLSPFSQLKKGYAGDPMDIVVTMIDGFTPYTFVWTDEVGTPIGAPNSATLALANVPLADNGRVYKVEVTDAGSTLSSTSYTRYAQATLQIATPFEFTDTPDNVRAYIDDNPFYLKVVADGGFQPLSYEWKRLLPEGGEEVVGGNTPALRIDPAEAEDFGPYDYRVDVSDGLPMTYNSPTATVEINEHLDFTLDLASTYQAVPDRNFVMTVITKGGLGDLTYVWSRNLEDSGKAWETIPGENESALAFRPLDKTDAGQYQIVINDEGSTLTGDYDIIESTIATLNIGTGVPVGGALGLALLTGITALGGALTIRRRK